jgi:four helix bundle protein
MFNALRNLEVWRRACRFSVNVYALTERCRQFAYRDQVTRSALSIASNIAEGYERDTPKDRIRFLVAAKGSCAECWTQLMIGSEADLIEADRVKPLIDEAEQLARMLRGLIAHFQQQVKEDPERAYQP